MTVKNLEGRARITASEIYMNFPCHTKPEFDIVSLFIQTNPTFLTTSPPGRLFAKLWTISRHGFRIQSGVLSCRYSSKR